MSKRSDLPPIMKPLQIKKIEDIPKLGSGKVDFKAIASSSK